MTALDLQPKTTLSRTPNFYLGLDDKGLRSGHCNVNRLTSDKFDHIKLFLIGRSGDPQIDVLFLRPDIPGSIYTVPGFTTYRCDRLTRCGACFLAFVNEDLWVKSRDDLENSDLEIIWLEVFPFKSKRSIYRPPFYSLADGIRLESNIEQTYS